MNDTRVKIGVLGGTFQPVHRGHVEMARAARDALGLDIVLLVPASCPPHKRLPDGATDAQRLAMLRRVCAREHGLRVEDMELRREGVSYTADTLRALYERYPAAKLYFIMGEDMLASFAAWHKPAEVAALAALVAFARGADSRLEEAAEAARAAFDAQVDCLPPVGAYSSTEIRERLLAGRPASDLVPHCLDKYIYMEGLYLPEAARAMFTAARGRMSAYRFAHTVGVWREAARMAERFGLDGGKARVAALLHDIAKELPEGELRRGGYYPPAMVTALLHAPVGAVIAREEFGVKDPDILEAIALHTTGDAGCCDLAKLLFAADRAEAGRDRLPLADRECLAKIRAETDLNRAYALALSYNFWYIRNRGHEPDPATLRAMEEYRI